MAFSTEIEKEENEKITLVVVSPRKRVTGWSTLAPNIYYKYVPYGVPTEIFDYFNGAGTLFFERKSSIGALNPAGRTYYWEAETQVLTVTHPSGNPDSLSYPGLTVQFDVAIATRPVYGRRDPFDSTWPDIVSWEPALTSAPTASMGTSDDFFGYQPSSLSEIRFANNGWFNKYTYDFSFKQAPVKIYVSLGLDYERAILAGDVFQIFKGFASSISESESEIALGVKDFSELLEQEYYLNVTYNDLSLAFPALDPAAVNGLWRIPRLYGVVERAEPVNVNFNATASTTNNREWATHYYDGSNHGAVSVTVDHTAGDPVGTATFLTTPPFNVGDTGTLRRNGVFYGIVVTSVDRTAKTISYASAAGVGVIPPAAHIAGDTFARSFVANVIISTDDKTHWVLCAGVHYVASVDAPSFTGRFTLVNNFEGLVPGFPGPFDPENHRIYCRLYGPKDLTTYADASTVGTLSEASGVDSDGVSLLFRMLRDARLAADDIDTASFTSVGAASHALGVLIPPTLGGERQTYKDVISQILLSQIWKVANKIGTDGKLRLGLSAVGPMSGADYSINNTEFDALSWEQDYADIYSSFKIKFRVPVVGERLSVYANGPNVNANLADAFVLGDCLFWTGSILTTDMASSLHKVSRVYEATLLQFDPQEALETALRISIILRDRRAFYRLRVPYTQLVKSEIGKAYQITRDHLPGFDYVFDAENSRNVRLIEVQKDVLGSSVTFEDQKAIEDGAGSW